MGAAAVMITPALIVGEVSQKPSYEFRDDQFVILNDKGGDVDKYAFYFGLIERSGMPVKVNGYCYSACTMVLHNPKACAMPWTMFGFHEARQYNRRTLEVLDNSEAGNRVLWLHYPEKVRAKLGVLMPYMVYIKGTDLLPACKD